MKKKLFTLLLGFSFVVLLVGCNSKDKTENKTDGPVNGGPANVQSDGVTSNQIPLSEFIESYTYFVKVGAIDKSSEIEEIYKFEDGTVVAATPYDYENPVTLGDYSKMSDKEIQEWFDKVAKEDYKGKMERNVSQKGYDLDEIEPDEDFFTAEDKAAAIAEYDSNIDKLNKIGGLREYPYTFNLITDSSGNMVENEEIIYEEDVLQTYLTLDEERNSYLKPAILETRMVYEEMRDPTSAEIYDSTFSGFDGSNLGLIVTRTEEPLFVHFDDLVPESDLFKIDAIHIEDETDF